MLGQWELIRRLGRGGMGEVYESFYRADRRRYAIKILVAEQRRDPAVETRFRHEFLALRQAADVPGLVRAHALHEIDGELFYSMELLQGRDLEALIKERPVPALRVLEIGVALTRILEGLHERGIIHRDIKPTNVIELDDGELRLVDLGIGKLLPPFYAASGEGRTPPEKRLQTTPGVWLGTPGYIAPEAGLGDSPTPGQDVFSLGVTLFRLATRRLPFPEAALPGALAEPRRAVELGVEIPEVLETVLRRAMIVEPAHRLQSMAAFRTELEDALAELRADDEELSRGELGLPSRPQASGAPRARLVALLALICAATTALGVVLGVALARPHGRVILPLAIGMARATARIPEEPPGSGSGRSAAAASGVGVRNDARGGSTTESEPEPASEREPTDVATPTDPMPTTAPSSRPPRPRPSMREALNTAARRLRRCAAPGNASIFVEFTVDADGTSFAAATPLYETDPELLRCVRRATSSLRFTPTQRQIFVEEYRP